MKKLLLMILMLGVSGSVVAKEIKLTCTLKLVSDGEVVHETVTFDEEAGMFGPYSYSENESCEKLRKTKSDYHCHVVFVTEDEAIRYYYKGKWENGKYRNVEMVESVDRTDGGYKYIINEELYKSGTCKLFHKAF